MRIMIVHGRYRSVAPSGENHVVDQESAALIDAGHQVELFQRESDDIPGWSLAKRAALPVLSISNPGVRRSLTRRLVEWRPDVVHVHNTFPVLSPSVLRACWSARVPVVATIHNYKLLCASGDFYRGGAPCHDCAGGAVLPAIAHGCYRDSRAASLAVVAGAVANRHSWRSLVSAYLFISASQRDLMSGLALPSDRVFVKHNFVDPPLTRTPPARQDRVACVGRLDAAKGAPLMMRAWDRFRALRPESGLRLAVAGGGPLADEVRAWGGRHDSVDVHGHLSRAEAADLMAGSRAVLVPSQWEETFGLVAVEAMAAGVAPIAPARGSFPELFADGVDGALFLPGDSEDLARVLVQVDTDPGDFAERGRRAQKTHARRFARSSSIEGLERAYRFAVAYPAYDATAGSLGREQE